MIMVIDYWWLIDWWVKAYQYNEVNVVFKQMLHLKRDGDKTYYILSHLTVLYNQFAS